MQSQKPVIVGIDPGTTLGLCILDCNGKILRLVSGKHRDFGGVISEIMDAGTPIAVGTDKKFVPEFIAKVAAKTGARAISPKEDAKVEEKREITGHSNLGNDHKRDALASAKFAYRSLSPLLKKISIYCERNGKENIKDKVATLVVKKNISINDAIGIIERKDEPEEIIIKTIEKKTLREEDFNRIADKAKRLDRENELLRIKNAQLIRQIANREVVVQIKKVPAEQKRLIEHKENRIRYFDSQLKGKEMEIKHLEGEFEELLSLMGSLKDNYLVKRLSNLGMQEFERKNSVITIQKDDMIYVDDTGVMSPNVIGCLKDKVIYIIYAGKLNRLLKENTNFIFIEAGKLDMKMGKFFCIVSKESFEKEKGSLDVFNKIVEDYKRERGI